MTKLFRLPDLGEGLTEATLMRWLVAVGDPVVVDQPIAEVETAKSVVEVPSPYGGTIAMLHGAEGELLLVGAPFVEVTEAGADASSSGPSEPEAAGSEERGGSGNVLIGYGTRESVSSGRTRRPRGSATAVVEAPPVVPSAAAVAPTATATAATATAPPSTEPVAVRSPIVRRLAHERGIDLHTITPTGPEGIVTRDDVLRASAPATTTSGAGIVRTEPLSMLRRTVAAKMTVSRSEIPEATVWVDVDVTDFWATRAAMADPATGTRAPSLTAMIAKYVLKALENYPVLGARLSADGSSLEYFDGVHLGVATDTDRGLMVPVIRNAERLSIGQLDEQIIAVAEAARAGHATPAQLSGSTFTLNNYGTFGVDGAAPIINHPEVALLGVGRMIERPWVVEGQIVPRRIAQVSLVFDHRVCDGGYASRFLREIVDAMEHPLRMYREL